MDQPGKVANPARGQLNRENNIPLSPCVPENLVSRDGFSRPVPRQPAHLHTQAESGAYLRDSSRVPRRGPFMKPPYAIGSVPNLSGHAILYRWRSMPRVRRHRASKPQGSFERVLPWQVTMDQLTFASLSHTHYWYEVGMLKAPAYIDRPNLPCLRVFFCQFVPNLGCYLARRISQIRCRHLERAIIIIIITIDHRKKHKTLSYLSLCPDRNWLANVYHECGVR